MHKPTYYLNALGIICPLGKGKDAVLKNALAGSQHGMQQDKELLYGGESCYVAKVTDPLAKIPEPFAAYQSRNNQLLLSAYQEIETEVNQAIEHYGKDRIAVILGTSTSGIAEGEEALFQFLNTKIFPEDYQFDVQEISDAAEFLAHYIGLENIATTVSTACSSSAKVFANAKELLDMDLCDAVIIGGVDSLCKISVNGFHSLGALSSTICNPFSRNRDGITIGEGAALFLMSREESPVHFVALGESSDAYSMTAPEPEGKGAEAAMRHALALAGLRPEEIGYVNLHGTATLHNDDMESQAILRVFGNRLPCSSTKSLIGHCLGAAGALEAGLCYVMLSEANQEALYLPHIWDKAQDPEIELTNLTRPGMSFSGQKLTYTMSNSFAFGGSNAALILGRRSDV